ncbi:hypothetical protein HYH02_012522 [Chlamydomonas schloesseri]|uniref:Sugar phosphate transporter domain-containing protein n=1 Tax=Chlamydomonas schloesseri TaxID=2026947 RepID=A0A835SXJ5_9CHLO|nr:hypothetical protein HYH02_012522 [Chlamydomonas schloesseri]|eukprot:KAG2433591.1 hypothetical protein HYH02_012522 [Chlamydomonas schloesseri]
MGTQLDPREAKMAMDVFAWFLNVSTSVLIVFVNKVLMDPKMGYKFVFATTLCAFHFLTCGASVRIMEAVGIGKRAAMPLKDCLVFAVIASVSIASLNLSLLVNSVGFYQISKLLIIPFVCLVEYVWFARTFTAPMVLSILVVVVGVAIVTVTDVSVNGLGLVIAAISVVTSGLQQIMCGAIQRRLGLTSNQLLSNTAPVQGLMLLTVGPFVDKLLTKQWIGSYDFNVPALNCLFWSCAVAVLVNISQFMCLGRFSAVTFQVLGHTKTVLVLICGWLYLGDVITNRKLAGMVLAVVGMALYGYFNSLAPAPKAPAQPVAGADKRNSSAGSGPGGSMGGAGGGGGAGLTEPLLGAAGAGGVGVGSSSSAGDAVSVAVHSRYHTGSGQGEGQ